MHIYFGVRSTEDRYGIELLQAIAARHGNAKTNVVFLSADGTGSRSGPVTDAIAADYKNLSEWRGYFFGVPSAVEAAKILAKRLGMRPDRLHGDAFYPNGM
jgi:ferredoxin-NAD(P)+ reductase (naphthalene dioxygenase ferredoxin-specific)